MEGRTPKQLDFFTTLGTAAGRITRDMSARLGKAGADAKDQTGPRTTRDEFGGRFGKAPKPSDTARANARNQSSRRE